MRIIIMILAALALTACASVPPPAPVVASGTSRIVGVATIAWGAWSSEIAPVATSLEMSARLGTARVRAKAISDYRAAAVLRHVEDGIKAIKIARQGNESHTDVHRAALAEAKREAATAAALLTEPD